MGLKRTSFAYLAGIVDGEGHIGLTVANRNKGLDNWRPHVSVGNTNLLVLRRLHRTFGGHIYLKKPGPLGRKRVWQWDLSDRASIMHMLRTLRPWLLIKRRNAKWVLRYINGKAYPSQVRQNTMRSLING